MPPWYGGASVGARTRATTRVTRARDKNEAHRGRGRLGKVRPRSAVASGGAQVWTPRQCGRGVAAQSAAGSICFVVPLFEHE
jgi:hypothetical protein